MNCLIRTCTVGFSLFFILQFLSAQDLEKKPVPPVPPIPAIPKDSVSPGIRVTQHIKSITSDSLSTRNDTTLKACADSVVVDSVRIRFIPGMGQILDSSDTTDVFHQKQFLWTDAKTMADLLWKLPGFFYRELGEAGKWGQLNAFGSDGRTIDVSLDGRPMNDPVTGTYNLSDMPLEFVDHTEIFTGALSEGASSTEGTVLNFVSRSYNSVHPLTKLRYGQDPKGTLLTDGLFTQNIARGLNLMLGFQRTTTLGRYENADLDAWNVRTRLRYNISDRVNISLTDFYTKAGNGLNGGVNPLKSATFFDEASAIVLNNYSRDSRSRHDLTLATIARPFPDSSFITKIHIYDSNLDREYLNPMNHLDDSTMASFWGIRLHQQLAWNIFHAAIGGTWERRQTDSTRTLPFHAETERSLFAQVDVRWTKLLEPSLNARTTSLDGDHSFSSGIRIASAPADWLTIFADASRFDRFPTIQEKYWRDSVMVRPNGITKEQHAYLQAGVTVQAGSDVQLNLTGFHRTMKNAIVYQPASTSYGSPAIRILNVNDMKSTGLDGRIIFHWHHVEVLGVMTLTHCVESDTVKTLIPEIILAGELSYRGNIIFEHWDGRVGVRSRYCGRQKGMQFDPQTLSYIEYASNLLGQSTTFDAFLILRIGNALLSISCNNIFDAGYMLGPIYPMQGRNIRVGVHWSFLD